MRAAFADAFEDPSLAIVYPVSKLAKNGEVQKAERGYRLAPAAGSSAAAPAQ